MSVLVAQQDETIDTIEQHAMETHKDMEAGYAWYFMFKFQELIRFVGCNTPRPQSYRPVGQGKSDGSASA
jgi:hypothetical protein